MLSSLSSFGSIVEEFHRVLTLGLEAAGFSGASVEEAMNPGSGLGLQIAGPFRRGDLCFHRVELVIFEAWRQELASPRRNGGDATWLRERRLVRQSLFPSTIYIPGR
jgi:hypothetical protein